jgi:hypothetical protein
MNVVVPIVECLLQFGGDIDEHDMLESHAAANS